MEVDPRLVTVAIAELPALFDWVRNTFGHANPDAPPPSDEEVIAAFAEAIKSSVAKDDAWMAAHPPQGA